MAVPEFPVEALQTRRNFLLLREPEPTRVSHKNPGVGRSCDLRVLAREPGPDTKTEQGQGDHGEWQRWQPERYVVHIEGVPRVGCS